MRSRARRPSELLGLAFLGPVSNKSDLHGIKMETQSLAC